MTAIVRAWLLGGTLACVMGCRGPLTVDRDMAKFDHVAVRILASEMVSAKPGGLNNEV